MTDVAQIIARFQSWLIDYDGTPIPDGALPIAYPTAGDLRALVDEVRRLQSVRDFNSHPAAPDPDSAVYRAMEIKLETAEAELALAREQSILNYNDATGLAGRLEAAEAELARLREPVGDVGAIVKTLQADGSVYCTDAADLLTRQAAEIAKLKTEFNENAGQLEQGIADQHALYADAEASLREAFEAIAGIEAIARTSVGPGYSAIHSRARDFLAKLEIKP